MTSFGIDFGTTNTRVAYYDGKTIRMVSLVQQGITQGYQLPTLVRFQQRKPIAIGKSARSDTRGQLVSEPLKWLLLKDDPIVIDGGSLEPVDVVAGFFARLKSLVEKVFTGVSMTPVALTIPVHYPPSARTRLQEACKKANIEVSHFFFEPIAAVYSNLIAQPVSGVAAVFDWGGGSLDIATVQIKDDVVITRQAEGWQRGGNDFDRLLCLRALDAFLLEHGLQDCTANQVLDMTSDGQRLLVDAEEVKKELGEKKQSMLTDVFLDFQAGKNLKFPVNRDQFNEWILPDVETGEQRLKRVLRATGVSLESLSRLFLSGGTCNVPLIAGRLQAQLGDRMVRKLNLPASLVGLSIGPSDGLKDIGNATAVGAALLAVHGATPVLSGDVGIRLAGIDDDRFLTVLPAGKPVVGTTQKVELFITDASAGVARLLVCERYDAVREPAGRLLRVIAVPIDKNETWLDVVFEVGRDLVLRVSASGRNVKSKLDPVWIQQLNLGFQLPPLRRQGVGGGLTA